MSDTAVVLETSGAVLEPEAEPIQNGKPKSELVKTFKAARRVSTPLVAIRTPDPAATMAAIESSFRNPPVPVLLWDIARGIQWRNTEGLRTCFYDLMARDAADPLPESDQEKNLLAVDLGRKTQNPFEALRMAAMVQTKTIFFFSNMHRALKDNPMVSQAIWNLRDVYKANRRTLVMLCPDISFPAELQHDILILDEPLPNREQLTEIVRATCRAGRIDMLSGRDTEMAVDALTGLAPFPAEGAAAMSLIETGIDIVSLRGRTNTIINSTPGLAINKTSVTFDGLGGMANIKGYIERLCTGKKPPRLFLRLEEIDKVFAGVGGDNTGVSEEYLGTLLTFMEDHDITGMLAVGPPGTGKTQLSNAAGNTFGRRTVNGDLSAMKTSKLGESKERLDHALRVLYSISDGQIYIIATCNQVTRIPTALQRRFDNAVWMCDVPLDEERPPIWDIHRRVYEIPVGDKIPDDKGWTGAEIKRCCHKAWMLSCSLSEAAAYVVPISRSQPEELKLLREQASGRFLSASYPGVYRLGGPKATPAPTGRTIAMETED